MSKKVTAVKKKMDRWAEITRPSHRLDLQSLFLPVQSPVPTRSWNRYLA